MEIVRDRNLSDPQVLPGFEERGPACQGNPTLRLTILPFVFSTALFGAVSQGSAVIPLTFEPNQDRTQHQDRTQQEARFLAHAAHGTILFSDGGIITLAGPGERAVRIRFAGANTASAATAINPLPGHSNYFIGKDPAKWRTGIPQFAGVRYRELYDGVDLVCHGNGQQLEYDLVVTPTGRYSDIRLDITGADRVYLDPSGDLLVQTAIGEIRQHRPRVYQDIAGEQRAVSGGFKLLSHHRAAFRIGPYDHSQALVIDPTVVFSTYFGGSTGFDTGLGTAVDPAGDVYFTGWTTSTDYPVVNALQASNNSKASPPKNAVVTKLSADGKTILYSTYIGGSKSDYGHSIAVDASGNAYIVGSAGSPDFPTTSGTMQPSAPALGGGFLLKLSPQGGLLYSTYIPGDGSTPGGVTVNGSGNAYVAGYGGAGIRTTAGSHETSLPPGAIDALYVIEVKPDASGVVFGTYVGGTPAGAIFGTSVNGITLGPGGDVFVAGNGADSSMATPNAFQTSPHGELDGFVLRLKADGSALVYSTFLGGATPNPKDITSFAGIAVDSAGDAYVAGTTSSTTIPTTTGVFRTKTRGGGGDGLAVKLNPSGTTLLYCTYLGGNSPLDGAAGIAIDGSGNAYISGDTGTADFPVTPDAYQSQFMGGTAFNGQTDTFFMALDPAGANELYGTFLGGTDAEYNAGLAIDTSGAVAVFGSTNSTDFPTSPGALKGTVANANGRLYVVKFSFAPPGPVVNAVVNGASFVGGGVVPGEIATVFGTNLTSASGINLTSSLPLPTEFLNVSVIVNDPAAPLFAVDNVNGQQQINFQVPWELAGHANANIAVSNNGVTGATINVPVLAAQPGIFAYSVGGNSFGAILHANFQLADTGHPAMAGETVLIYCTGLGAVNTTPGDGVAGNGQTTVATPSVTMGGKNAAVSFSGLAPGFVGLYQINAVVASGLASGNQPVIITMQGASSNSALLPVK